MCTLVKELPSLTSGTEGNSRFSLIVRDPALRLYRLDITSRRSDVVLTGKKRLRGTFIPKEFSKLLIAAPTAVSSWITFRPPSKVWKRKCSRSWDMLASWVLQIQFNSIQVSLETLGLISLKSKCLRKTVILVTEGLISAYTRDFLQPPLGYLGNGKPSFILHVTTCQFSKQIKNVS